MSETTASVQARAWTVRPATLDDVDGLSRVHRQSWRETYEGHLRDEVIEHFETPGVREGQWTGVLSNLSENAVVVVAEQDGKIVGFAHAIHHPTLSEATSGGRAQMHDETAEVAPREWYLSTLYTLASTHGTGLGKALLDASIGDKPAFLWHSEGNARAERFYEREGFRPEEPPQRRWEAEPFDIRLVRG